MAAPVVRAIDQKAANARGAHLSEGDFLLTDKRGHASIKAPNLPRGKSLHLVSERGSSPIARRCRSSAPAGKHRAERRDGAKQKRRCYQRRSGAPTRGTGPLRLALAGATRSGSAGVGSLGSRSASEATPRPSGVNWNDN